MARSGGYLIMFGCAIVVSMVCLWGGYFVLSWLPDGHWAEVPAAMTFTGVGVISVMSAAAAIKLSVEAHDAELEERDDEH